MKQTELRNVKKGDFFRLANSETAPVWVRGEVRVLFLSILNFSKNSAWRYSGRTNNNQIKIAEL